MPQGQVVRLAGAEQDPVEREHRGADRLHRGEQRPEGLGALDHPGIAGERLRDYAPQRHQRRSQHDPSGDGQLDHPLGGCPRALAVAGAQPATDDDLPGDRDRVEHERQQAEQLHPDLMGGQRPGIDARQYGAGHQERAVQRRRAQDQRAAHAQQWPHQVTARPATVRAGRRREQCEREGQSHARLGDHRAPRRPGQTPVQPVDEDQLEDDIQAVGDNDDDQWSTQIADPARGLGGASAGDVIERLVADPPAGARCFSVQQRDGQRILTLRMWAGRWMR